jgi:predicted PolB exonuclease-like 3'-5' exonuclease
MLTVVLDIETMPDVAAAERAGIDLAQGFPVWPIHELACVSLLSVERDGWSFSFKVESFTRADLGERGIIASVERALDGAFEVVTFNGRGFDVPVLMARAALARERCPMIAKLMAQPRRLSRTHVDLLEEVTGYGAAPRVKLSDLCAAFDIPVKMDAHGSDVASLAERGEWEAIAHYCETDVVATWLALQFWRSAERDEPHAADAAWSRLAGWIESNLPVLAHLLPYADVSAKQCGSPALSGAHIASIRF